MKKDYTHICLILDSSSSMECVKQETKETFNGFMEDQRKIPGKTTFDLFLFWNEVKRTVNFADLAVFKDDLMAKYRCSGCTALLDAICIVVDSVGTDLSQIPEEERPENVLIAIITDGEENSSKRFSIQDVRKRIDHQTHVYNWKFVFLGANIDAFDTGTNLGISNEDCIQFTQSPQGMKELRGAMYECAERIRSRSR